MYVCVEEGQGRGLLHYVVEIRRKPAQAERAGTRREEEGEGEGEGEKKNRYTASTGDTWWWQCVVLMFTTSNTIAY